MEAVNAHNSPSAGLPSTIGATHSFAADAAGSHASSGLEPDYISTGLDVVAYVVVTIAIFQWLLILISHLVLQRRYVKLRPFVDRPADEYPPVTIIRPLKGVDKNMRRTLESSFCQEYPASFEILFAVEDPEDPAIALVEDLIKQHPKVAARVLVGQDNVGINPKVNNMLKAFTRAQSDLLWICDSNVHTDSGTLRRSVDLMLDNKRVGVVHHVVFSESADTLGAMLDNAFLVTNHCRMYLAINAVGTASCLMGKSNLYYKSALDSVGGLASFGQYLAEDNMIGQALWRLGWQHTMTGDLARQPADIGTFAEYCSRRIRWVRTRMYNVPIATMYEPMTESIVLGLLTACALKRLYAYDTIISFGAFFLCWFGFDMMFFYRINHGSPSSWPQFVLSWLCREALALPLWAVAIVGDTVVWRGQKFRILKDGAVKVG
ncbi:Ceramide glucosyltransferase [Kickxella alabastrina]|uniref:Ceramide glucosyltransferase n=1 Tax=Kickxella alabastrina TaxID=61397 RepID=A0ACC1ISW8_9FUNG|nr:Ceramide glucosyltransferase [Kickxella alabastrina]